MTSISFSHFVLGILLITLLGLKDCDAYSNRGTKNVGDKAGDANMVSEEREMSSRKESFDAVPVAAEEESGKFGGRKFMMDRRQLRNEMKRAQETCKVKEEASKISGSKITAKDLQKPIDSKQTMDDQCGRSQVNAAEPTRCRTKSSSDDHGSFQKLEAENLLEAANQIINLMNKDYPGGGGGGHKPPINNHEPQH